MIQNFCILIVYEKMNKIVDSHKIIKSKKKLKSLKGILTSARLYPIKSEPQVKMKRKRSQKPLWKLLPYFTRLQFRTTFQKWGNFKYKIDFHICIRKRNIYFNLVRMWKPVYKSTSMTLRHRTILYKEKIKQPQYRQLQVREHIDRYARNLIPDFISFPFYQCSQNTRVHQILNK